MVSARPKRHEPRGILAEAREAYEAHAWARAHRLFHQAARQAELDADDLERRVWCDALLGLEDEMLGGLETLFHLHVSQGHPLRAARAAFWLGFRLVSLGQAGRASGWLGRAERLVRESGGDCVETGYLLLPAAHARLAARRWEEAAGHASEAEAIGTRFGDHDLAALARSVQGLARLTGGELDEAFACFDEAMLETSANQLSPIATGLIYCTAIACCQRAFDLERAREWTAVLERWCESQPELALFSGECRLHRAEILQWNGQWKQSLEETDRVAERFSGRATPPAAGPSHYQRAEIHRLRGERTAAEREYRLASESGRDPMPGLALLLLARGETAAAASAIGRALDGVKDPLQRARLLPAAVEIRIAAGDLEGAGAATAELASLSERFGTEVLRCMAEQALGALRLASGDAAGALEPLRAAFEAWRKLGAPYLAARARVQIGTACSARGDREGARLEFDAARDVFASLGAGPDLERLPGGGRSPASGAAFGLTPRELQVLRLLARGKTNRAIARELFVSERTIDRHVSNLFAKLDVSTRAAATAIAYERALI